MTRDPSDHDPSGDAAPEPSSAADSTDPAPHDETMIESSVLEPYAAPQKGPTATRGALPIRFFVTAGIAIIARTAPLRREARVETRREVSGWLASSPPGSAPGSEGSSVVPGASLRGTTTGTPHSV